MAADDVVEPPSGDKPEELPPAGWMGSDDASNKVIAQREAARRSRLAGTTEFPVTVPPPPEPAPVDAVSAAVYTGAGQLTAHTQILEGVGYARDRSERQLSDNPVEIRDAARALAQAVKDQIAELKEPRLNDTKTADFIDFLEMIARELDKLVDALDRAIASVDQQGIFLGEAKKIADQLKTGFYEYLEQHRADIAGYSIKISLVSAAAWFLHACGFDLASIISLFKK